ncbi:lytic transglycosylase domain-containing protein [Undibacterium sp. TC4M20W]|uniref:lytic transglycosylase domain-containing protein n=2 Tax=unclassified Undibacterium TaxID=2630295 RepID=UPI003BF607BF
MKYFFLRFCVWCKGRVSGSSKFDLQAMQATRLITRVICEGWKKSILQTAICLLAFSVLPAQAGNQKEEAMADSVRLALAKAVSDSTPPKPTFANIEERIKYLNWQGEMATRLKRRIPDLQTRKELLDAIWYESKRAGLDVAMVMGLIQVESAFRKYATSVVGARGYMQVMPFWSRVIGDGDAKKLFQMQTNLRYGCSILRLYIDMEKGDLYLALGRYNGSRGRPEYPKAVLSNWKNWEFTS